MNPTLIDLGMAHVSLVEAIVKSEGEITPELEEELLTLKEATNAKIETYSWIMDRLESEATYWKQKAEQFSKISRGLDNAREKMKDRLRSYMELTNQPSLTGIDVEFRLVKGADKVEIDAEKQPMDFPEFTRITATWDKDKIKHALQAGSKLNGIRLAPSIYVKKFPKKSERKLTDGSNEHGDRKTSRSTLKSAKAN